MNFNQFTSAIIGSNWVSIFIQFILGLIATTYLTVYSMKIKTGSLKAILITSYPRVIIGILVSVLLHLAGYHVALLIRPYENWWRLLLYVPVFLLCYLIFGGFVNGFGIFIDCGKAIRVITNRYQNGYFGADGIDVSRNYGESAQFIPRGANAASSLLFLISFAISLLILIRII